MKNGDDDDLEQAIAETHDMANTMETEEQESLKTKHVQGSIHGFNGCALFLEFTEEESNESQYCLFRAHRIFLNGVRVPSSRIKGHRMQSLMDDDLTDKVIHAEVRPMNHEEKKWDYKTMDGTPVAPSWYSHCVWVGDPWPPETERKASSRKTQQAVQNGRERSRLDNQEGEIVYRNLSGLGYIYFEHNGSRETATFHSAKLIKDGKRISHGDFKGWPTNHKEKVKFNAVAIPPKVHVQKELGDGESMDVNITYESRWRCEVVWMPPEPMPSQEVLTEVSLGKKHLSSLAKDAKDKDFYICGKLTHFVDKSTGIIQHSKLDQAVLFKIQDLFIDGVRPDPDARLSSILQVGETLFSFSKPLIPSKTIGATVCNMTATQIWKGKRNKSAGEAMDEDSSDKSKKKVPYPDPRAATDINQSGVVIEIQGVLGKLKLTSDDPARDGQKVLLSKNRTYINGHKIRFKDFLHDYVQLGERLSFDMIEADQSAANGEYQWLALLSWKNVRPTQEEVDFDFEKGRKDFSLKAKIIKFDDHDPKQGFCSGVLQIYAGPNNVGERVIFHREQLYVFSTRMAKADLAYIFKTNDRVQVEIEPLEPATMVTLQQKYGCEIKFRATMVWIGVAPKLDLDCDQYPCKQVTPWMISPFLHKRGLDEEIFARLVKGEMPPKEYVVPSENSEKDPLPPNRVPGHVVQLKKPDHGSMGGTQCGIMSIDGGPYSGEKAFFSRTCVYIYGYRMTKADLMHVIKGTDKFNIEVQGGTNNKSVPYSVTSAWIGPQPNDKGKDCPQDMMNKDFCVWLQNHDFKTLAAFERVVSGEEKPKPFFPIAQETQIGRIMHLYPCVKNKVGEGVDCGIIKIQQGSLAKKDVLFERESIYLWGVNFRGGDITYFLKEGTKVMVEVSEIIGKDRKKWQTKLGSQSIPKYTATIVYVGGGRPKESANKVFSLNELNENTNLKQWLNKRGRDMTFFHSLLCGKVMPYRPPEPPQLIPGGSIWERRQPAQGNNAQVSMQYHNNKESSPGYEGAGFPMASPHHSSSHPPPPPFHDPSSRKGSLTEQQQPPFLSKDSPWSSSRSNLSYAQQQQQSMQNVPDPQQSNHHSRHHPPPHLLSPPYSHANNHSSHNHHAPLPHHLAQGPPAGSKSPWSPERNPSPTRFDDDQSVSSRDSCPLVIQNPIMKQAERMLSKVMACSSLEDPKVSSVIDSETDYQLANFISKTLETCLRQYRHKHHQQDPIGPPKRSNFPAQSSSDLESRHGGNGGLPAPLPSSSVASVRDGLYGLQEPLLGQSSLGNIGRAASGPVSRNSSSLFSPGLGPASPWMPEDNPNSSFESENRVRRPLRRESPVEFNYGSELFEPPYKRKHPTEPGNNSCANNSHHQQMF